MIIDMHVHSEVSVDAEATVEEYCRVIQRFRAFHPFHGIVLTEHRQMKPNPEYRKLAEQYDVLIFQGVEIDANLGHMLLYGMTDAFLKKVDITHRGLKEQMVLDTLRECGGIAVPSHPFRGSAFGAALETGQESVKGIKIIEEFNGANFPGENELASQLVARNGLKGIGGSDGHFVDKRWFLTCATEFFNPIRTMEDMVSELYTGNFRPVMLDNSVLGDF